MEWLLIAKGLAAFANKYGLFVQLVLLGVPLFILFGFFNLIEFVFGPETAPAAVVWIAAVIVWRVRRSHAEKRHIAVEGKEEA